ncbi:MAG: TlpA disulfide reductase family protein, partial [Pirellulaceae bacterium]
GFAKAIEGFKKISAKSEFAHFGSSTPNLIAQDFEKSGNQFDVNFYDNSSAVFSDGASEGKSYGQIALGTLVKANEGWRVVELPALMQEGKVVANGGIFLSSPIVAAAETTGGNTGEGLAKLYDEFEKLDKSLRDAKPGEETEKLQAKRVDVLMQLIQNSTGDENRSNWIRQMADTVMNAYETGVFEKGLDALEAAGNKLKKDGIEIDNDYIAWRVIAARYSKSADGSTSERAAASERFQKDLEGFIAAFPKSELAPEGLNQIALYAEVNGNDEESLKKATDVYARIEKEYPQSKWAARAKGARTRINSIGEKISFSGKTINNQPFDLKSDALRGKVVVLHYWATWCDVCVSDFAELQRLGAKFKEDLVIVGVNLDDSLEDAKKHLSENSQFKWSQLFAPGGIADSPLAVQLGVSTLPLIVLIDQEGKVVDTGLSAKELDRNIQRVLK